MDSPNSASRLRFLALEFEQLSELLQTRLAADLRSIRGVGPDSETGQRVLAAATRCFEELVDRIARDVERSESILREELSEAGIEIDYLRRQLGAAIETCREANRARRPGLVAAALLGLGSILGAVATGAVEGISSTIASKQTEEHFVERYADDCLSLAAEILSGDIIERDRMSSERRQQATSAGPTGQESAPRDQHEALERERHSLQLEAGWYNDPGGGRGEPERWWNGSAWTAAVVVGDLNNDDYYQPKPVPWPPPTTADFGMAQLDPAADQESSLWEKHRRVVSPDEQRA